MKTIRSLLLAALVGCASLGAPAADIDRAELDECVATLLASADPGYPVQVVVQSVPEMVASATWRPVRGSYLITVDPEVVEVGGAYLWHIMAHEWAHLMIWDAVQPGDESHDALWGVSFARAYRILLHH